MPRQSGSGTDTLFRHPAARAGLDLASLAMAEIALTEDEAVETVRRGKADSAIRLESLATSYGLDFLSILNEEFALLVDRKAWFEPPIQTLMAFSTSKAFRERAKAYGGYEIIALGTVAWIA